MVADLQFTAPIVLCGLLPLILLRWRMNLLSLDDDEAQALGVNVGRTRLIIPHIARLLVGADFRYLLPACSLLGASFLIFADTLARSLFVIEIPLGIITATIGAPFFLWLLIRGRNA